MKRKKCFVVSKGTLIVYLIIRTHMQRPYTLGVPTALFIRNVPYFGPNTDASSFCTANQPEWITISVQLMDASTLRLMSSKLTSTIAAKPDISMKIGTPEMRII